MIVLDQDIDNDQIVVELTPPTEVSIDDLLLDEEPTTEEVRVVQQIVSIEPVKRVNYVRNKDILREIHNSKISYSEFIDQKYSMYDVIVEELDMLHDEATLEKARQNKASRIASNNFALALTEYNTTSSGTKPKLADFYINPDDIDDGDLVFRVMTYEHIPLAPGRKNKPKTVADRHERINFVPFKHYILEGTIPKEVGRSHSHKGQFSVDHGSITKELAKMFILMVDRYAQRGNWRSYTYLDEMKSQSLLQLSTLALKFNEHRTDNPFCYLTACIYTSFVRVFNLEKLSQTIRDDLLINSGALPSFSRQLDEEEKCRRMRMAAN